MAKDTDVVIVGAGPIGLVDAWAMKRLNPDLKIVVIEKYPSYKRSHTLRMQYKHLEELVKITGAESDPKLKDLIEQLKRDPNIRTNELQKIFADLAEEQGVTILYGRHAQADTLQQKLKDSYPNARLIHGADGTHSVVSKAFFPKDNQVKHEFDFVLQLRFEINGDVKADGIKASEFYQEMARKGLIANEYVGPNKNGKTPITMQMMITKEDFLKLQEFKSKTPLYPFTDETKEVIEEVVEQEQFNDYLGDEQQEVIVNEVVHEEEPLKDNDEIVVAENTSRPIDKLPRQLKSFISSYLQHKMIAAQEKGQELDAQSVRISVNEAPATNAKKVVTKVDNTIITLRGDAALGLSYFIGLNAGLESSVEYFKHMKEVIQNGLADQKSMKTQLAAYEKWFLNKFVPQKVAQVAKYSFWNIRPGMAVMKKVAWIKASSMVEIDDDEFAFIRDYARYYTGDQQKSTVSLYPHRPYAPVKFGQIAYVPLTHTLGKMAKLLTDNLYAYKSDAQVIQDFKQPLVGLGNIGVGLIKMVMGLFLKPMLFVDGVLTLLRGVLELATWPLAWTLKPLIRGVLTSAHGGYKKIEENKGIRHLAKLGAETLQKEPDELNSIDNQFMLRAICHDLHRKFEKQIKRGQNSDVVDNEKTFYEEIAQDKAHTLNSEKLSAYFGLFATKKVSSGNEEIVSEERNNSSSLTNH